MQVWDAIEIRNPIGFERAMHRLQDSYSHYDKGYRFYLEKGRLGHVFNASGYSWSTFFPGETPDQDYQAWMYANKMTKELTNEWIQRNGKPCRRK